MRCGRSADQVALSQKSEIGCRAFSCGFAEIQAGLPRTAVMSSNMIAYLMAGITMIVSALVVVGFPALAIVVVKYFKLKERELTLDIESRQEWQQQHVALEQRVQRLEDVLSSLDQDVRVRLGIDQSATPLPSHPELLEGPAASEVQRKKAR